MVVSSNSFKKGPIKACADAPGIEEYTSSWPQNYERERDPIQCEWVY